MQLGFHSFHSGQLASGTDLRNCVPIEHGSRMTAIFRCRVAIVIVPCRHLFGTVSPAQLIRSSTSMPSPLPLSGRQVISLTGIEYSIQPHPVARSIPAATGEPTFTCTPSPLATTPSKQAFHWRTSFPRAIAHLPCAASASSSAPTRKLVPSRQRGPCTRWWVGGELICVMHR